MEEETLPLKWEGKTSAQLPTARAHEVWPFLEDFCNIHKCFRVDICYHVDGIPGQPGLIRCCASTVPSSSGGQEESATIWAKEKLLLIDPIKRCLSYEVIDNNIGLKSYVATMRVLPIHDDEGERGCKIEWSFLCDPVQGQGFEEFSSYIQSSLQFMVKKIEDALQPAT
ncbi:lachrymatory-factor synthase-like [Juglans microcarpa x Juglans regia]|uniref:lachrymatory-factor synthase-like n=1 Tax=Juglans microcarpa x Juglans regia TaxID=2249226 RepID=UPI001B7F063B|nr:lachrymatory-factor synthase-like [Juglans microcarpa x Juglans regia]